MRSCSLFDGVKANPKRSGSLHRSFHCKRAVVIAIGLLSLASPWTSFAQTCTAPPSSMVGWWPWEGNGIDTVNGNTATLTGSPTFAAGEVNQAIQLDGSTQFAFVPATAVLDVGASGAFTVDLWIKPNDVTTAQPLVEWNNNTGGGADQGIGVHFWLAVANSGGGPGSLY